MVQGILNLTFLMMWLIYIDKLDAYYNQISVMIMEHFTGLQTPVILTVSMVILLPSSLEQIHWV